MHPLSEVPWYSGCIVIVIINNNDSGSGLVSGCSFGGSGQHLKKSDPVFEDG